MDRNLHVVYASDDNFAEILGVSLTSLYENNKEMEHITVYVLDGGISDPNKEKLETVNHTYGRESIQWIEANNISQKLHINMSLDRGSLTQYARLFVSSVLPKDIDKILYLDCDTIVMKSLEELWNLNMHGKLIAALMDAFSKWYRTNIDLQPNDVMFNSGVMLIDLKLWREQGIENKLIDFIKKKKGKIQQGDQGVLNAVLSNDIYCFEPRFNSVTIFYDFSYKEMLIYRKPPMFYTEDQVEEAVENPVIIHFTTSFLSKRPWYKGCEHRYLGEWEKYKNLSPWEKNPNWGNSVTMMKRIINFSCEIIPKCMIVRIAGIFQAYLRPLKNRLFMAY